MPSVCLISHADGPLTFQCLMKIHIYIHITPWVCKYASRICFSRLSSKLGHGRTYISALQWRHNGRDGVSNHQHHHCLLNHLFRRWSKKTSKFRVAGLRREIDLTGYRWIPRTNGQSRGKWFHSMTSSWLLVWCCTSHVIHNFLYSWFVCSREHSLNLI